MLADNESVGTTLISGDPELCKTFLFETAISYARDGQTAIYFATKQMESLPPVFHDRGEASAHALNLIRFIHTPTYEELAAQLIKLHTFQKTPSLIIVDDLDVFTAYPGAKGCSRELHVARCCVLILNAASNCSKKLNVTVQVCAASFYKEESEYTVYKMYFDNRWLFSSQPGDSGEDECRRVWMKSEDGRKALEFRRLDDAVLVLRGIFERNDDDDDDDDDDYDT